MKTIRLSHPHPFQINDFPPMAMALGYFDGVHKGHQKVILTAKELAKSQNLRSAVMTFDPHPSVVLRKDIDHMEYITPLRDKEKLIQELGIDLLFVVNFSQSFASLLPQEFVDQYIIGLHVKHVVAGFDFTYGRLGKGTMETLPFHSRQAFSQTIVEKQTDHDRKISSTLIRNVIRSGDVQYAMSLLGRPHQVTGKVVHGEKRGRLIGFPTANIDVFVEYLIPPTGVYAVSVVINEKEYFGVANIGYKPTFHQEKNEKPHIEVHIFNFNQKIYNEVVTVKWFKRIRSEQKFHHVEQLIEQINKDKQLAQKFFAQYKK
ncbi:bifunctional riboflavin kinase/FAD synthetase [Aeribacillus alveayuensis]|uniref:Riboflavin biosynthesis protein n=1 Tax=Aeribacillus alveayuensis TaxID=279215 RepID=A0ABT9VLN4_9BACI|nr:riboflavin kinase/FMN adenylyltransferase [Bacillus alveayuensis]